MTEASEAGSIKGDSKYLVNDNGSVGVKKEFDVTIKIELNECVVCLSKNSEQCDITSSNTETGTPLYEFLYKYTHADIANSPSYSKFICKTCLDLVNVLEHAEIEYFKVKEAFESIINKNPLFESQVQSTSVALNKIKNETTEQYVDNKNVENDSEDEPLALTKKKRRGKAENRKKKTVSTTKRKFRKADDDESWECSECKTSGKAGGQASLAAHILVSHAVNAQVQRDTVKKEVSPDRSQSSIDNGSDDVFKVEGFDDDDDSSNLMPDECSKADENNSLLLIRRKRKAKLTKPIVKQKREKVIHYCDKCNAKYTSIVRLEQHKLKHDDSKPPYICEVCGAHYKHKRACDVHVAMHKGISDWKCVECNKLFPSKGALQRHNNIHTGKLNYQCDLCGKSFIHTSSFKMHKLSHSGVKPHSCDVCGLALMTRSHLKRHKRVHSGEKRHECATCGKRFSERYNLLAHARAHDGGPPPAAPAPRRLFRCAFCVERFERRYMLERHCAVAHGRSVERPPPTPRNTMSKLLKAQAQRREPPDQDSKNSRSPDAKTSPVTSPQKNALQAAGGAALSASAWAGAYAAEFGLRPDYTH